MGKWTRERVNSEDINGGNQYEAKDRLSREQLNAMVNSGLYAQDFAEHLADTPDTSDVNNVGTPTVELINNGAYKKFKFSNLKGESGNGVAYIQRNTGLLNKETLQGFIGTTRTFGNISGFNGKVGDFVYIPFSISDEGGSIGNIILKVTDFTSTSVTGKCMQFIYAPQGEKGDKGDLTVDKWKIISNANNELEFTYVG